MNRIYRALSNGVANEGETTNSPMKQFKLENMPEVTENYSTIEINGKKSLVPKADLDRIVFEKGTMHLASLQGNNLMQELGYQSLAIKGSSILYFKPSMKPV